MASLETVMLSAREDVIVNHVLQVSPATCLDERFNPHGDPQDMDDTGKLDEAGGPNRLFDVYVIGASPIGMTGSTTQDYDVELLISVFYPKTVKGGIAMHADKAAIDCSLNKQDSLPSGVQMYIVGEPIENNEMDDYMLVSIPVTVRVTADI